MKFFFAFLLGAGVVFFLLSRPSVEKPAGEKATSSPRTVATVSTSAPGQAKPAVAKTYKELLSPVYLSLVESTQKSTDLVRVGGRVIELRRLIEAAEPSASRDAALRLCNIIDRGIALTRETSVRYNKQSVGSSLAKNSEQDGTAKDEFFHRAVESQWRSQMEPLILAAQTEWSRIANTEKVTGNNLQGYLTQQQIHEHEAAAMQFSIRVVQVLGNGVLADLYESYAISSGSSRVGLGGPVGVGSRVSGKIIFVAGVSGVTDGETLAVKAYRDGVYTYTDVLRAHRTVERWTRLNP